MCRAVAIRTDWALKLIMSQVVEGTWIHMGGNGQFRGEWVNPLSPNIQLKILQTDLRTFPYSIS